VKPIYLDYNGTTPHDPEVIAAMRLFLEEEFGMHGAGQEMGRRPGTENILEIVGLGKACEITARDLEKNQRHMQAMRDRLHAAIADRIQDVRLNGHPEKRLPNTLSLSFRNLEANRILEAIGMDVAASAGAACHADSVEISHVLKAMGVPMEWAKGTLRLTTGRMTTAEEIDRAGEVIVAAASEFRCKLLFATLYAAVCGLRL
jgi:cysteine desulfurase